MRAMNDNYVMDDGREIAFHRVSNGDRLVVPGHGYEKERLAECSGLLKSEDGRFDYAFENSGASSISCA